MLRSIVIFPYLLSGLLAAILLIFALTPGLNGGFLFDDSVNIVDNQAVHMNALTFDALRQSLNGPAAGPLGRPVSVLSFALTHYVFGLDPFAFKAINLALHAVNGALVAILISLLLRAASGGREPQTCAPWIACWVAAVWLLHPINVVPIMLAVQRMTLLSGMFLLLALISHLKAMAAAPRSRLRWIWLAAGWAVFWPLSVLSKESGVLFPVYAFALGLLAPSSWWPWSRRQYWMAGAALAAVAAVALLLSWNWLDRAYAMRDFTLGERLLTEARVVWFYLGQIIVPRHAAFGLYLDDFPLSTGVLAPPSTLPAVLGLIALAIAAYRLRRRYPAASFAVAWFLGGHLLESTVLPLEIAHEHRNYLPSIGLIAGLGLIGARWLERRPGGSRVIVVLAALLPIVLLALLTWLRANQLGNPLIGPQVEAQRHPQSARANHEAALALIRAGYGDAGDGIGAQQIRYYLSQAQNVSPSFKLASHDLIFWACTSGREIEGQWISTLSDRLARSAFAPGDFALPGHLLKRLIELPKCLPRQQALGLLLAGTGNTKISPTLRAAFFEMAADYELLISHDPRAARGYLAKAAALWPENSALRGKLHGLEQAIAGAGSMR
ncbi:MAG TPA: pilus assembly protein PilF [Paucimonas sp.]|nr:pilus assembly protein PilF [Paucimonas sp.]